MIADLVAARREMPVEAGGGGVQRAVLEPLDRYVAGEARVLDLASVTSSRRCARPARPRTRRGRVVRARTSRGYCSAFTSAWAATSGLTGKRCVSCAMSFISFPLKVVQHSVGLTDGLRAGAPRLIMDRCGSQVLVRRNRPCRRLQSGVNSPERARAASLKVPVRSDRQDRLAPGLIDDLRGRQIKSERGAQEAQVTAELMQRAASGPIAWPPAPRR